MLEINNSIRAKYYGGISKDRQYIVVHYTANTGDKATARGNANYFANCDRQASAHFVVDENEIYCTVPEDKIAWAVGGNKYPNNGGTYYNICGNVNSLSIEMVSHSQGDVYFIPQQTINNTMELVKHLQEKYGIDNDHVIRHYDVNGKPCPWCWTNENGNNGVKYSDKPWKEFKERLAGMTVEKPVEKPADNPVESDALYRVQIGAFKNKDYAIEFTKEIKKKGYDAFITTVNGMYKIQVGAFRVKANAEAFLKKLESDELDGFIVTVYPDKKKVTKELVAQVIQGEYGNGELRRARLEAEGYDYNEVQQAVNEWIGR